jgi:hypothetical protein
LRDDGSVIEGLYSECTITEPVRQRRFPGRDAEASIWKEGDELLATITAPSRDTPWCCRVWS